MLNSYFLHLIRLLIRDTRFSVLDFFCVLRSRKGQTHKICTDAYFLRPAQTEKIKCAKLSVVSYEKLKAGRILNTAEEWLNMGSYV